MTSEPQTCFASTAVGWPIVLRIADPVHSTDSEVVSAAQTAGHDSFEPTSQDVVDGSSAPELVSPSLLPFLEHHPGPWK